MLGVKSIPHNIQIEYVKHFSITRTMEQQDNGSVYRLERDALSCGAGEKPRALR